MSTVPAKTVDGQKMHHVGKHCLLFRACSAVRSVVFPDETLITGENTGNTPNDMHHSSIITFHHKSSFRITAPLIAIDPDLIKPTKGLTKFLYKINSYTCCYDGQRKTFPLSLCVSFFRTLSVSRPASVPAADLSPCPLLFMREKSFRVLSLVAMA